MRLRDLPIALILIAAPCLAQAHPHVWVDTASEILFDDKGRIASIRHHWRFDEAFSAYALQGLDLDRDGQYSAAELEPLAKENVESLSEFDYFTFLSVGDYQAGFSAPKDYHLDLSDGRLILHFTLPLAMPLLTRGTVTLGVYDPEYYVAFSLPSIEAVRLVDAPQACKIDVHPAQGPDAAAAAALAEIGADQRTLPQGMQSLTTGTENSAEVNCGEAAPAAASAGEAITRMTGADTGGGDLTALPSGGSVVAEAPAAPPSEIEPSVPDPGAVAAPTPAPPSALAPSVGPFRAFAAWIAALQTAFNHDLTGGLKSLKDGGAFWWLGGVSFLYGIVHAAGPGHGKVVISSYLVANELRVRRGVAIAFLAAFVQAVVAVAIIGIMAIVLNMTSMAIDSTAKVFEAGSFALVAGLGLYLLARKGRAAWAMMRGGDPHAHHHHHHGDHHGHDASPSPLGGGARGGVALASESHASPYDQAGTHADHCHDHRSDPAPTPSPRGGGERVAGLSGAAAAVFSVGIRPCSGALVVLVFALAQGVFWAGVASTFLMALGTALTVAALAALAVGAKDVARRLARGDDRRGAQVMLGLELAAALFITAMGAVLFVGTVAS